MLITTTTIIGIVATAALLLSLVCLAACFVTVVAVVSTRSSGSKPAKSSTYMLTYLLVQDNTEANSRVPESERVFPSVRSGQSFKILTNVPDNMDLHKLLITLMSSTAQWTDIVPLSISPIPDGFADAMPSQLVFNVKTLA